MIIKTLVAVEPTMLDLVTKTMEHRNNCFELYGFDVIIDSKLKPWILEVNVSPSLSSSSPLDRKIKHSLLSDILNLVGNFFKIVFKKQYVVIYIFFFFLGVVPFDKKKYNDDRRKSKVSEIG